MLPTPAGELHGVIEMSIHLPMTYAHSTVWQAMT